MLDASINTSIAKYFITFVELAVGESMNPSKLRFQGASSIIRSDTQACKWWEVQWDHFNKDQKWNENTFRPGAEVQQGHIFKDQRYNTNKEVLDQGQNSFFEYNAFCKWLLTRTMDGSTRCRVEGEINLNLNYICEGCSSSLIKMVWAWCWWQRNWFCLKSRPKLQLDQ